MYRIELTCFAEFDIQDSVQWYNEASNGLGKRFYINVKSTISLIQRNPKHFPERYKNIHTARVKKFPFMIHYQINETGKAIIIIGIIHTSRNPKIWDERGD